jgi:hypothetical protein
MNVKVVKGTDELAFETAVNAAIVQLQQQGMVEFSIQYQPLYMPAVGGANGYVIYTALIIYK